MKRQRVHFVYPHGALTSAPHVIGAQVTRGLAADFEVINYNISEPVRMSVEPGDILLGHPSEFPLTAFRLNMRNPRFSRVVMLRPFHCHLPDVAHLAGPMQYSSAFLAITGPYWFDRAQIEFPEWAPNMVHLDLAVDRQVFPAIKRTFAAEGRRKFLYIGNRSLGKNIEYLKQIAAAAPEYEFAAAGGDLRLDGVRELGYIDLASAAGRAQVANYDFLLMVGRHDANPTSILEAMAFGLIPICTQQSGYAGIPTIPNIPLDDVQGALSVLTRLQGTGLSELLAIQAANFDLLDSHYNWTRFLDQVRATLTGPTSRSTPLSPARRRAFTHAARAGEFHWLTPGNLIRHAKHVAHATAERRAPSLLSRWRSVRHRK